MRLLWEDRAWEDYLYWQMQDKKTLKRINALIKDIARNAFDGIGKPEPPHRRCEPHRLLRRKRHCVYRFLPRTLRGHLTAAAASKKGHRIACGLSGVPF